MKLVPLYSMIMSNGILNTRDIIILNDNRYIVIWNINDRFRIIDGAVYSDHIGLRKGDYIQGSELLCEVAPELLYHLDILEECKKESSERYWNRHWNKDESDSINT